MTKPKRLRRNDFRRATPEEIAAENRRVAEALLHQPVKPPRKISPANPKAIPRVRSRKRG